MNNLAAKYPELAALSQDVIERASKIEVLLMDVDGVLTDGKVYYSPLPDGGLFESKGFDSKDGLAFHMCKRFNITTGLISGRNSQAVVERARNMHMKYVYQGHLEKEAVYAEILADAKVDSSKVAYVGDDFTDWALMKKSGLGCAVADASPELHTVAHYLCRNIGGRGAIREVVELILKSRNLWDEVLTQYQLK